MLLKLKNPSECLLNMATDGKTSTAHMSPTVSYAKKRLQVSAFKKHLQADRHLGFPGITMEKVLCFVCPSFCAYRGKSSNDDESSEDEDSANKDSQREEFESLPSGLGASPGKVLGCWVP